MGLQARHKNLPASCSFFFFLILEVGNASAWRSSRPHEPWQMCTDGDMYLSGNKQTVDAKRSKPHCGTCQRACAEAVGLLRTLHSTQLQATAQCWQSANGLPLLQPVPNAAAQATKKPQHPPPWEKHAARALLPGKVARRGGGDSQHSVPRSCSTVS